MANGIAAGFAGNEVMFSEAYLPYAWPEVNRHTTAEDIVAICPLGNVTGGGDKGGALSVQWCIAFHNFWLQNSFHAGMPEPKKYGGDGGLCAVCRNKWPGVC
ncbi:Uncharacterised protein [Escherichia coli]|uniref:Uncharacterized protein n=1 Tax=Escherichia coli TaxID=562 RepID=A0A376DG99_ECOLX|nr:Uncharacterised protein [Escherichia coli]